MDLQVKLLADDLNSISKSHDRWEEPTPKVALWPPHPCVLYTSVSMSVMNLFIYLILLRLYRSRNPSISFRFPSLAEYIILKYVPMIEFSKCLL